MKKHNRFDEAIKPFLDSGAFDLLYEDELIAVVNVANHLYCTLPKMDPEDNLPGYLMGCEEITLIVTQPSISKEAQAIKALLNVYEKHNSLESRSLSFRNESIPRFIELYQKRKNDPSELIDPEFDEKLKEYNQQKKKGKRGLFRR